MRRDIAGSEGLAGAPMRCAAPACGKGVMTRRSCRWHWSLLVLVLLACSAWSATRQTEEHSATPDGVALRSGGGVWITIDDDFMVLDEEVSLPSDENGIPVPPGIQGMLAFSVASPLPEWEVRAQFEWTTGPEGPMEAASVMVRSAATGEEFVPVADSPIIASGHGPLPATDLWLELQVRPGWTDAPGPYGGILHLVPIGSLIEVVSEIAQPGGGDERRVPGSDESDTQSGTAVGGEPAERTFAGRATVPVQLITQPLTLVMTGESGYTISTPMPGRYFVEPDLDALVATNETQWELVLEGTDFVNGSGLVIPLERVEWSMLDEGGEPGEWTSIGDDNCLMAGNDERGIFIASFRLALEVYETDTSGVYVSEIHLSGAPR